MAMTPPAASQPPTATTFNKATIREQIAAARAKVEALRRGETVAEDVLGRQAAAPSSSQAPSSAAGGGGGEGVGGDDGKIDEPLPARDSVNVGERAVPGYREDSNPGHILEFSG